MGDEAALARSAPFVRRSIATLGVVVRQTVRVELRSRAAIERALQASSPMLHGVTRFARDGDGRLAGRQCITIRSHLTLVEFEACLAHELTHLALLEQGALTLPVELNEGIAEFVAHRLLVHDIGAPPAMALARSIERRHSDPYGDGFDIVSRAVARFGFSSTWQALVTGRYRQVGVRAVI